MGTSWLATSPSLLLTLYTLSSSTGRRRKVETGLAWGLYTSTLNLRGQRGRRQSRKITQPLPALREATLGDVEEGAVRGEAT